jgi:hypothetical protein
MEGDEGEKVTPPPKKKISQKELKSLAFEKKDEESLPGKKITRASGKNNNKVAEQCKLLL